MESQSSVYELRTKTYLLEGTCSFDKALNTNAWLSAAKVVKELKKVNGKGKSWEDWCSRNEANVHERNVGILILALLHAHGRWATG